MDRNDRELRSSPAIICKIAVAVSRPPITCLHLPPWKCTRQLPVENSSQGWIHQPASSLPTDHLLDSILQQYK